VKQLKQILETKKAFSFRVEAPSLHLHSHARHRPERLIECGLKGRADN
jgi:hypothetical protein